MPQQTQSEIAFLAFNCIQGASMTYFQHVCIVMANLSGQAGLRSAERGDLIMPRTATELRKRSFSTAALLIWNSLPDHLCSFSISKLQLQRGLKTQEHCIEECVKLNCTFATKCQNVNVLLINITILISELVQKAIPTCYNKFYIRQGHGFVR